MTKVDSAAVKTEDRKDHSVLHPPQTLKTKAFVVMRSGDPTPEQTIKEAEHALEEVAVNFQNWMSSETDKLASARANYRAQKGDEDVNEELFQAAHTVRGNAGVFGFPLAGRIADSLAKLLANCPGDKLPGQLIDQHVDAIRAVLREDARGSSNPKARELAIKLVEVTADYLAAIAPEDKTGKPDSVKTA